LTPPLKHCKRCVAFCSPGRLRQHGVDDQTIPVLHQQMPHVAKLGRLAAPLLEQARIGIGGR
jgi:hypothetical protein